MYLNSDLIYLGEHESVPLEHHRLIDDFCDVIATGFLDFSCDDFYNGDPAFSTRASVMLMTRTAMMRHPSATEVLKMTDQERKDRGRPQNSE